MAVISLLLGGVVGSVAAVFGWLLFGMSFASALGLYAVVALGIPSLVLLVTFARPAPRERHAERFAAE